MRDELPPAGRYYGGTLMKRELIPAGDAGGVPFEGEYLLIEVHDNGILWSLHSIWEYSYPSWSGEARVESRSGSMVLVLDEPSSSGVSTLFPLSVAKPKTARAYLVGLMTGLPNWPLEVRLPDSLRSEARATEERYELFSLLPRSLRKPANPR